MAPRFPSGKTACVLGIVLAIGYFTFLYRSFRGKVTLEEGGY